MQSSSLLNDFDIFEMPRSSYQPPSLRTQSELAANFLRRFYLPVIRCAEGYVLGQRTVTVPTMLAEAERRGFSFCSFLQPTPEART